MIELKHYGISFAAVHTRVCCEVLPYAKSVLLRGPVAHDSDMRDVSLSITEVPLPFVLDEAGLAPRVADAELRITEAELIERLLYPASTADFRVRWRHRTDILSGKDLKNKHRGPGKRTVDGLERNRLRAVRCRPELPPYLSHVPHV